MRWKLCCRVERMALVLLGALCLVLIFKKEDGIHHPPNDVETGEMTAGPRKAASENISAGENKAAGENTTAANNRTSSQLSWPTCQRNTSMASDLSGFSSLPAHIQDFLNYRHCRHFPLLLDVPDKCGGPERSRDVFLLLVIKSSPENYERRDVLRKTWGQERSERGKQIRRVFLVGTTGSGFDRQRLNRMLELEQHEHGDIVQWDFKDSLFNLTLKQVLFLEWMDRNCPHVQFLLNGDDDIFANTDNMVEYLLGTMDDKECNSRHLLVGYLIRGSVPFRTPSSKYFVPVQVQESNLYPPYCGGGGFLLSGYTASVIYNMSKSITLHPIDDVYMGMCLAKAGLKPANHMGINTYGLHFPSKRVDPYHPCFYRDILLAHRFMPPQIYVMWHQVRDPHLKCGGSSDFTV